jgi:hypothetical protein
MGTPGENSREKSGSDCSLVENMSWPGDEAQSSGLRIADMTRWPLNPDWELGHNLVLG